MTGPDPQAASLASDLSRVHRRLVDKHLLLDEEDAVSVLLPGSGRMLFRATAEATWRELPLTEAAGIPGLHAQTYRLRPDAGALASISTQTSRALAQSGLELPIVFDEQARHIGKAWQNVPLRDLEKMVSGGANAGPVDGRLLVIGVTPNRMVFNAELFEKCTRAYLLARGQAAPGRKTLRIPWWVCLIARRRLRRDQAAAARHHAAGEPAPELTAY